METNTKNAKKGGKNKKNILYVILWVIVGAIILGGVVTAFILNYNTSAPTKITILDDGHDIYVHADMNDNYHTYRFKFVNGEDEIIIDSDSNTLFVGDLLSQGIVLGQTYQISVCYLSENEGNNSEYSQPTEWTVNTYLSAPLLVYDDEDLITWEEVANADYYMVYINELAPIRTEDCSIDLQSLSGGERSFVVKAYSDIDYYKDSPLSNELSVTVVHRLLPFESINFDEETKVLTLLGSEELAKIDVYLGEEVYECIEFSKSEVDGQYTYEIDLSLIYLGGMTVGACPSNEDEYNVYEGEVVYAEGFEPASEEGEEVG